jgi:threonine 3-dehydrogenase
VKAIAKVRPEPGVELIDAPEPRVAPGTVKIRLEAASVCGTDVHIFAWDPWAASRIRPPRIIGHEFCGTVVEVGSGVSDRKVGDFVSSESHIVCGECRQCRAGQAHVCVNTRILGVDVDGGFAPFVTIPAENARPTDRSIPAEIACFQDALGNAVHTAAAGPVEGRSVLITGMGPIGLFAASVCKALGAARVIGTEISPFRAAIARQVGVDVLVNPKEADALEAVLTAEPDGVDATLEMSGHPSQLELAVQATRPGGRVSLLGVYAENAESLNLNDVIFKGLDVQGIVGRRLWETWDLMGELLSTGRLNVAPVVTHRFHYSQFAEAMGVIRRGEAGKVVFRFND